MIIFFAAFALVCLLGAAAGWYLLRRWGLWQGVIGVVLGLAAGSLLFPFPIHGGVMFLGEVMWDELADWRLAAADREEERRDEHFRRALEHRFAGDLPFVPGRPLEGPWLEALLEDGSVAWYDAESGMVWRDPETVPGWRTDDGLDAGRRFCASRAPGGYWALPTEGELVGFWAHAGHDVSPWTGESTPSVLVDETLRLELPVWFRSRNGTVAVRCVARGPRAPKAGYLQSDVDMLLWNRYQLEKGEYLRGSS
jgi:hypothetical protein